MNISRAIKSLGTLSIINFARKHADKLSGNKNAAISSRAPVVASTAETLENAYAARRPLVALQVQATKKKDAADDALDAEISALSYDLLAPRFLNGDRHATAYRALFPKGNIGFIEDPVRAELAQVNGIVSYLKGDPEHPMSDRAPGVEGKAAVLEASLEPQSRAVTAQKAALKIEGDARDDLKRTLRKSVFILRAELDGKEKLVDALFPSTKEAKVPEEKDPIL